MTLALIHINGFGVDSTSGLVYGPKGTPIGSRDSSGYLQIDGRTRGFGILAAHRLVWEAVHGPIPADLVINHKNGAKTDNRISNLELVTQQENVLHAFRTGLSCNQGDRHPNRKLSSSDVREIRRLEREGISHRELAGQFGVTRRTINHVVNRLTWSHIGD